MTCEKKKDVSLKLTNVKNVGKKGNFENNLYVILTSITLHNIIHFAEMISKILFKILI